jgi:transcriptional regulator with XRE-family HTH domain
MTRLQIIRMQRKITQTAVAERLGISKSHVSAIENRPPDPGRLRVSIKEGLEEIFQEPIEDLFRAVVV